MRMKTEQVAGIIFFLLVSTALTAFFYLPPRMLPSLDRIPNTTPPLFGRVPRAVTVNFDSDGGDRDHEDRPNAPLVNADNVIRVEVPREKADLSALNPANDEEEDDQLRRAPPVQPTLLELANRKYPVPTPDPIPVYGCEHSFYYAIFSGFRTFNRSIPMWQTWGHLVADSLALYTDREPEPEVAAILGEHRVRVVKPVEEETLKEHMSGWSHIVRVRDAWEHRMRDDPKIEWLFLLDDDVYLALDALCYILQQRKDSWFPTGNEFNWGGLMEFLPYDWLHNKQVIPYPEGKNASGGWTTETLPQGAVFLMHRRLVEAVYPHLDRCERETAKLKLKSWGSQRLWACVNLYLLKSLRDAHQQDPINNPPPPKLTSALLNNHMWKESMYHYYIAKQADEKARLINPNSPGQTRSRDGEIVLTFHHLKPREMFKLAALHNLYQGEGHFMTFAPVLDLFHSDPTKKKKT